MTPQFYVGMLVGAIAAMSGALLAARNYKNATPPITALEQAAFDYIHSLDAVEKYGFGNRSEASTCILNLQALKRLASERVRGNVPGDKQ